MPLPVPTSLDTIDPARAWEPWQPDRAQPWDLKWAGHLYRRAAFGAPLAELRQAVQQGLPATLDKLCGGAAVGYPRDTFITSFGDQIARASLENLRGWWVYCMLYTSYALREKMTLFWHNHFATSIGKVGSTALMYKQNSLLRQHALGKFRPFLLAMSRDPAMLLWLDSNENIKGKANENYARELMELFSLGVGHYSETDIREAARAFTGWQADEEQFDFNALLHDDGPKSVLGQQGKWNGDDIVRIVLEQPAAAVFLVRKLYRFFISETANPPAALLAPLADALRRSDFDILLVVRTILSSRHFFSEHAYRHRIKSPVEFTIGLLRAFGQKSVPPAEQASALESMGQPLFAPPNVKGWEGGRSWLNTSTVLARHNYAEKASKEYFSPEEPPLGRDAAPEQVVGTLVDLLLQGDTTAAARARLTAFLTQGKPEGKFRSERIREVVHAILTMPEYQLA